MTLETLTTDRLRLRAWTSDDASTVLEIYGRDDVSRFLGSPPKTCVDLDDARARIDRWASLGDDVLGLWAVETPGIEGIAPQPCGSVLLVRLGRSDEQPSDTVEIGWHFHPSAWGHGIATEGGRAMIERARAAGLREVHAVVFADNAPSLKVCDRLGMTRLGPTDEWYGVELVDHVLAL